MNWAPVAALLLTSSCASYSVRDSDVYTLEGGFHAEMHRRSAAYILEYADTASMPRCLELAELGLMLRDRAPWHQAMQQYLIGRGPDPGPPPPIHSAAEFCNQSEVR